MIRYHEITYHEKQDRLFPQNLFANYNNNILKVLSVSCDDYIGASIKRLHKYSKSKEDIWWDAEVVHVDKDSDDMDHPDFFIRYKNFEMA